MNKSILLATLGFFCVLNASSQITSAHTWTFVDGYNFPNVRGEYGQKTVEAASNWPGARVYAAYWRDHAGNFWLWGGYGMAASRKGQLNDMWRYNVSNGRWTWMAGDSVPEAPAVGSALNVESPQNTPNAREGCASWTSTDGKELYLTGGFSNYSIYREYNDVWAFNTVTNRWRYAKFGYVNGVGNCSGQFNGALGVFSEANWNVCGYSPVVATSPAGFAYLFGGAISNNTYNNHLMGFSDYGYLGSSPLQWGRFISPAEAIQWNGGLAYVGNYSGSSPYPGGRYGGNGFMYGGKFHFFGGKGYGQYVVGNNSIGNLNDIWRYDDRESGTNRPVWTYLKGSTAINNAGSYGTLGVTNPANYPASRNQACFAQVTSSQFVLFGGNHGTGTGSMNDLWTYNAATNNWTWIIGSSTIGAATSYGIKGVQSNRSYLGARSGAAMWVSRSGEVYVFGGGNNGSSGNLNNDLWKFSPKEEPDPVNDEPCNAIELSLDAPDTYGNNAFATVVGEAYGACSGLSATLWYKYTPAQSGRVQFKLGPGLNGRRLSCWLGAFVQASGSCPSSLGLADSTLSLFGTCKYYNSAVNPEPTLWSAYLNAGKTYFFRVTGNNDIGRFSLSLQSTEIRNIASGNWNDPAIWMNNRIPTAESNIRLSFPVTVSSDAICRSLTLDNNAHVNVQGNVKLTILKKDPVTGFRVYFKKPADWASTVKIHVWGSVPAGVQPETLWPGNNMTPDCNGWYYYSFPPGLQSINIVFNDGNGRQTIDLLNVTGTDFYDSLWLGAEPYNRCQ